ncbi:YsnF/AvaK domain-containing protein [Clostridium tagluense]|uniref:YsnF/AvaK domain-containing protein n=1 Tax=Clostridium tagluense TaxID=360422 RepID=UPI001C6F320A|nr:YsnF/AvaK domain-containing protein [Clostridium tagluense]MBW9155926.1 YsnF/AvaK domain-containing protein [Clostridium tagluense]WLC63976.1 YsnF/AvaK domain-containing protein [Clostridium tagluense]
MATFHIKKEELNVAKEWMQTGEVNIYREIFTVEKSFTVPIKREELVIKKKNLTSTTPQYKDMPTEVIRILLNEEHVEFTKHKVDLEDVSIYKQQIQDIKHIEETLKREEPIVKISESLKYSNDSNY